MNEHGGLSRSTRQQPIQLTTGPMNIGDPVPSRDGKRLFVQGWRPRGELVRYDARSGQFAPYLSGISAMGLDLKSDRKSTRLNSSHGYISYAVFCLKKKKKERKTAEYRPGDECDSARQA